MQGSNILVVCYLISGRNWIYIDLSAINNSPICTALIYLNQIKFEQNKSNGAISRLPPPDFSHFSFWSKSRRQETTRKKEYKEYTPEDIYAYFPLSSGVIWLYHPYPWFSSSKQGSMLSPRRHLMISRDISGCHS